MIKFTRTIIITACCLLTTAPAFAGNAEVDAAIQLAKAEAIRELNISETDIRFVQSQASEWRDSSLGCPEKGMQYLPVVTPGHVIKLLTDTHTYTLHVGAGHAVVCNEVSGTLRERSGVRNHQVMDLVKLARDDLNNRLGNSEQLIRLAGITPTQWADASLGCPAPDTAYTQAQTAGYVIIFEHSGESSIYHTDLSRVTYCDQ